MTLQEYIGVGTGFIATIVGLSTFIWKVSKDENDKRSKIYEHLDRDRKCADDKFVQKEICKIIHDNVQKTLDEIKIDIKLLLRKNGISN